MWLASPLPRTFDAAIRDLDEPSPAVRASALADLARHHDGPRRGEVEGELVRMLRDRAPEVRARAAEALGDLGVEGAVEALLRARDDAEPFVRQLATAALGALADPRAREAIADGLTDRRPEVRFQAIIAAPRALGDDADEGLAAAFADPDAGVRYIALRVAEERWHDRLQDDPARSLPDPLARAARSRLDDERPEVRVAAALLLAAGRDASGAKVIVSVVDGSLETPEGEDEAAAVEAAGALSLEAARVPLERRAYGPLRLVRDRYAYHARIALARLGVARAQDEILGELGAFLKAKRTLAVVAAGRARLAAARPRIEAMRGRPDRADPEAVEGALALLSLRPGGPPC